MNQTLIGVESQVRRIGFALVTFSVVLGGVADAGSRFRYFRDLDEGLISILTPNDTEKEGLIQMGDHQYSGAEFCQPVSEYFCFDSGFQVFAVPRHFPVDVAEWRHRHVVFRVVERNKTVRILGKEIRDVMRITAEPEYPRGGAAIVYLYSKELGLVGYCAKREDEPELPVAKKSCQYTFWLMDDIGFGAGGSD